MSFNKKAKREAAAQQAAAYAQQQAIAAETQRQNAAYQASFDKRNAGIKGLRDDADNWLKKYRVGTDISTLLPADMKINQQAADTVRNTMVQARNMGDASQLSGDADYQAKLSHVAQARLGTGLAAIASDRLTARNAEQTATLAESEQYLNADRQAGLGLNSQTFGMANQVWSNARQRRMDEVQIGQMAMQNLMGWVNMGVGAVTGFAGAFRPSSASRSAQSGGSAGHFGGMRNV